MDELEVAVKCMRAGAFDYMVKAVEESRLASGVRRAPLQFFLSFRSVTDKIQQVAEPFFLKLNHRFFSGNLTDIFHALEK